MHNIKQFLGLGEFIPGLNGQERQVAQKTIRAPSAANEASFSEGVFHTNQRIKLYRVDVVPDAAVTGQDTHTRHLNLINKGTDGGGSTELGSIDFVSGTDATAFDTKQLYANTSGLEVAAGSVLAIQNELVGTGLALPRFTVTVEYEIIARQPVN